MQNISKGPTMEMNFPYKVDDEFAQSAKFHFQVNNSIPVYRYPVCCWSSSSYKRELYTLHFFHLCPPHHHNPLPPPPHQYHHYHQDHLLGEPSGGSWGSSTGGFGSEGNYTILIIGHPRWLTLSAVIIIDSIQSFDDSPTQNDNKCQNYLNGPVVDLFPGAAALAQHCPTHLSWLIMTKVFFSGYIYKCHFALFPKICLRHKRSNSQTSKYFCLTFLSTLSLS